MKSKIRKFYNALDNWIDDPVKYNDQGLRSTLRFLLILILHFLAIAGVIVGIGALPVIGKTLIFFTLLASLIIWVMWPIKKDKGIVSDDDYETL